MGNEATAPQGARGQQNQSGQITGKVQWSRAGFSFLFDNFEITAGSLKV